MAVKGTYDSSGKHRLRKDWRQMCSCQPQPTEMTALDEEGMIESDTIVNLLCSR